MTFQIWGILKCVLNPLTKKETFLVAHIGPKFHL